MRCRMLGRSKNQSQGMIMYFTEFLSSARTLLWSPEAAGWAQAAGTMLAIFVTYWLASKNDRKAREEWIKDEKNRGLSLALALLPDVSAWHARLTKLNAIELDGDKKIYDVMKEGGLAEAIRGPQIITSNVKELYLLGEAGRLIQKAIRDQAWLVDSCASAIAASYGNSGNSEQDERERARYFNRMDWFVKTISMASDELSKRLFNELG